MSIIRDLTATLPSLLVIPVGLAIVKRFAEQTDTTTAPKPLIPTPVVPVVPVTPVIPTPVVKPVMPTQQEITRERFTAPSGTPEQAALLQQAYTQGRIKPFGTGVSLKDLFGRQR